MPGFFQDFLPGPFFAQKFLFTKTAWGVPGSISGNPRMKAWLHCFLLNALTNTEKTLHAVKIVFMIANVQ